MTKVEQRTESARIVLRWVFGIVPIVAGLDKYLNLVTDWSQYLSPAVTALLPVSPDVFMGFVGIVEIAAGVLVLSRWTTVGAYLVAGWLVAVALNLVAAGHLDVAVRDLAMAAAAFSLARLDQAREARAAAGAPSPAMPEGSRRADVGHAVRAAR